MEIVIPSTTKSSRIKDCIATNAPAPHESGVLPVSFVGSRGRSSVSTKRLLHYSNAETGLFATAAMNVVRGCEPGGASSRGGRIGWEGTGYGTRLWITDSFPVRTLPLVAIRNARDVPLPAASRLSLRVWCRGIVSAILFFSKECPLTEGRCPGSINVDGSAFFV